jgi:hypothetical protein
MKRPGVITSQVLTAVADSDLVVADLTDHNPNVFYELAIRHAVQRPVVQLIDAAQELPFDVANMRTIYVDIHDLDSAEDERTELKNMCGPQKPIHISREGAETMYASVRHYSMGAGSIDTLMHRVDDEFAPAISQEPGFVAYFALATGDATVETVSIFRDRAAADASNELASDYVRENLGEFELARTEVSGGEVFVSRVTAEAHDDAHLWRTRRARLRAS